MRRQLGRDILVLQHEIFTLKQELKDVLQNQVNLAKMVQNLQRKVSTNESQARQRFEQLFKKEELPGHDRGRGENEADGER